jgi:oxygen-independent coproporphyrinogen-3 oxidase
MNKEERPGLYIHVPFCRSKCLYCDFYSVASLSAVPDWLKAVRSEILFYREDFHGFDSLYIGGGTPTVLEDRDLGELIETLHDLIEFSPDSEMTIEANPESLTDQKLKIAGGLGINRISIGVQSLDDGELKYLGRIHNSKQALDALDAARSSGFDNIGVDLINGFEIQTLKSWRKTLDRILDFGPEHISCYQLTLEKGAPLWKMKDEDRIKPVGDKLQSAFFIWTSRYLERHGYYHYEISNFSRSADLVCRHNTKYWNHAPYLGLGPSAHSFHAGRRRRWWNVKSVEEYCRLLAEGKPPVAGSELISDEKLQLERLYLGFRTKRGVDIKTLGGSPQTDRVLSELKKHGLVEEIDGRLKPTRKGFLVADSLPLQFN